MKKKKVLKKAKKVRAAKKAKKIKKKLKAKKVSLKKARLKPKKAKVLKKKKTKKPAAVAQSKGKALKPAAAPLTSTPPKAITYSQESTRPLPGGFERERTQVTESPGRIEVDQEKFSIQEGVGIDEENIEEDSSLPEEEDLLDVDDEDSDLPPHLK